MRWTRSNGDPWFRQARSRQLIQIRDQTVNELNTARIRQSPDPWHPGPEVYRTLGATDLSAILDARSVPIVAGLLKGNETDAQPGPGRSRLQAVRKPLPPQRIFSHNSFLLNPFTSLGIQNTKREWFAINCMNPVTETANGC
jgi:hypothetical protein